MFCGFNRRKTIGAAVLLLCPLALYYALPFCVEKPDIAPPPDAAVYDRHGTWLGYVEGKDGYRCQPLQNIPPQVERALLTAEDKRFHYHGGVDPLAAARAVWQRLFEGGQSGASTISMQVAKMYSPPAPRSWRTKVKEILQARRLEMAHSKQEILLAYLNRADFSNLCRGVEAAARFYFGKAAAELSTSEAATLAGLVKAPSRLNPRRHPDAALQRRNYILQRLGEPTTAPLGVGAHPLSAPPIAEGRPGRLTLDAALQQRIFTIAREELARLRDKNVSQAAVMVADNRSGEVLALLPAAFPESLRGGALNGAAMARSAGSTLKPFVYLQAFCHGAWPGTILADVPTLYANSRGIQAPRNYNENYLGPVTMRQALACSQNIPAMEALENYGGIDNLVELLERVGYAIPGNPQDYGLGLSIGNAHVTLPEQVQAFSTLARNGKSLPLQYRYPLQPATAQQLLPAEHCYRISHILADHSARAATFGSAPNLTFPFPVAAKTGTSSNYRDNWCVGYTAEFTVAVWVGNFDNSPMRQISGVSGAGPIFHRVISALHESTPAGFPPRPDGIREICIDTRTGCPAARHTPPECRRTELATAADLERLRPAHYDSKGRVLLNSRYEEWYARSGKRHLYALVSDAPGGRKPTILIPSDGTTIVLDPTLPNNGRILELRSSMPAATVSWHCDTLPITRRNGKWYAELTPGEHRLRATAPPNLSATAVFRVRQP